MSVCDFLKINFLFKAYRKVTKHGFKGRLWGMFVHIAGMPMDIETMLYVTGILKGNNNFYCQALTLCWRPC